MRFGNRSGGGSTLVFALAAAGALVSSCSSSNEGLSFPAFVPEDCRGELVELARFRWTFGWNAVSGAGAGNSLALDGDTLFMTYAYATTDSGLPPSGGIVAVPVAGGAARVVGAADPAVTTQWSASTFWVSGGRVYLQTGRTIQSYPVDAPTPSTLPVMVSSTLYAAYVHDADFGYSAEGENFKGLTITKTPLAGGAPTTLVSAAPPNVAVGGMADAGDALLLHVRWHPEPTSTSERFTRVWRIPKDGAPHSDVRPDLVWAEVFGLAQWLAWDGADILGPINVQNYIVMARVPTTGTSAPEYLKLYGSVATRRGDEILSFQTLEKQGTEPTSRLLVASSKGAPGGSVLACGAEHRTLAAPAGIAANDSAIYVSYKDGDDLVIARVSP